MSYPLDTDWLRLRLAESRVFDAAWYLLQHDDVVNANKDPLDHFCSYGWLEGRWPNCYFDPSWYRLNNPDVLVAGADPLEHYLRYGENEGRRPHPLFDPVWYRSAYCVPTEQLAFGHFVANRTSGRFAPSAELFAVPFITPYHDDPPMGIDPFAHYLTDIASTGEDPLPDLSVVRSSGLIDENYYLTNAADVHEANADPVYHYCRYGWREHRKPNIYFDPIWYRCTNIETVQLSINPLVHYILVGEPKGRRPAPFFDPGWYRAEYTLEHKESALAHYLANRRKQIYSPTPLFDVKWYVARFAETLGPNRDPFVHYLQAGMTRDIDPSRWFSAARYRQEHLGRPSRNFTRTLRADHHHPFVHFLRSEYKNCKL